MKESAKATMAKTRRGGSKQTAKTILLILAVLLVILLILAGILFFRSRRTREESERKTTEEAMETWWLIPRSDGTFKVVEENMVKEPFQPDTNLSQINDGFSQRDVYVRNGMSLLEQSLSGYNFFEKGECDNSRCRIMSLTNREHAFWVLNQFHKEITEASRDHVDAVPGVQLLADVATVIDLDPLTIRIRDSREAGEDDYVDVLVGYGRGHLPLLTGYQWLLYLWKLEKKPLPKPDATYNYAIKTND